MNVNDVISALDEAEQGLSSAKEHAAHVLYALIEAAGIGKPSYESIIQCYRSNNHLYVETEWSARSCRNTSEYKIPLSIVDADDPMVAAAQWKIATELRKKKQDRANTLAEIERLQRSL